MKKKIIALLLAIAALSGCALENNDSESSQSAPADSQSSTVDSESSESTTSSTESSTVSSVKPNTSVDKTREQVYVDYEYIDDPDTLSRRDGFDEIAERALAAISENEDYKYFIKNYKSSDSMNDGYWFSDNSKSDASVDRIYKNDFDCDGTEEYFALVAFPTFKYNEWKTVTYIVYIGEFSEIIGYTATLHGAALLDYGFCKQLVLDGYNGIDFGSGSKIVGVIDGKPKQLYSLNARIYKLDCFVTSFGMGGMGDFMIYDNVNGEYRAIMGDELTAEEIYAMDKTDSLADRRGNIKYAVLLCEKFYMILKNNQDTGQAFTYENGTFTQNDTRGLRISLGTTENTIRSVNYDSAVGAMLTPEQARQLT